MKSSKFRKSARGQECTFRIPGVCNYNTETTVLCHAPHPDKGVGFKSTDLWAAMGCSSCHDVMDGRMTYKSMGELTKIEKQSVWFEAIRETQRRWIQMGLLPTG